MTIWEGCRCASPFSITTTHPDGRLATQLAERLSLIEAYERLGYYAYQLAEHHSTPLGIATPHLMLAAASQRTTTIRLGTLISILPLIHPMRMIEEAATLDQLTGGRLVLGVGRGISPIETGFHGVPGDEAQGRFDEAFEILRLGLSSDVVDFQGKYYQLESAPVVTHPVQQPMPLWYATMTLERARWCAQLAMPMLALVPSRRVRPLTDAYRAEWAALGRPADDLPALGISRQIVIADTQREGDGDRQPGVRRRSATASPTCGTSSACRCRRCWRPTPTRASPPPATATRATRPAPAPGSPSTPRPPG